MADIYDTFRDIGIIPVVAIEDASKAADLAHALVKGGLPASEVTFRTACAAEAIEAMIDKKSKDYASIAYLDDSEKEEKLFENQAKLLKQPICRNGKTDATVGMAQKVWEGWK